MGHRQGWYTKKKSDVRTKYELKSGLELSLILGSFRWSGWLWRIKVINCERTIIEKDKIWWQELNGSRLRGIKNLRGLWIKYVRWRGSPW